MPTKLHVLAERRHKLEQQLIKIKADIETIKMEQITYYGKLLLKLGADAFPEGRIADALKKLSQAQGVQHD